MSQFETVALCYCSWIVANFFYEIAKAHYYLLRMLRVDEGMRDDEVKLVSELRCSSATFVCGVILCVFSPIIFVEKISTWVYFRLICPLEIGRNVSVINSILTKKQEMSNRK
jgi:hypothetical protein